MSKLCPCCNDNEIENNDHGMCDFCWDDYQDLLIEIACDDEEFDGKEVHPNVQHCTKILE